MPENCICHASEAVKTWPEPCKKYETDTNPSSKRPPMQICFITISVFILFWTAINLALTPSGGGY